MKFLLKLAFYLILLAVMGFLLVYLFFQKEFFELKDQYFPSDIVEEDKTISDKEIKIAYAFNFQGYEPTLFDPNTRTRILNMYEGLVGTDRNLQIESRLALSWGRVHDTIWEFKLRPNVKFHDGTDLDADDVVTSFKRAMENKKSELKDILSTVDDIEKKDDLTVTIYTKEPDPILVNRIANVLIFPSEKKNFAKPTGTGPYKFNAATEEELALTRFDDYWGKLPYYKSVFIKTIENRFVRFDSLKNGEIDILANVPPTFTEEFEEMNSVNILSLPSLEVNFLVFNFDSELLSDKRIREAIAYAFDKNAFVEFSDGFASPSYQFVSNGIFGFDPEIEPFPQDINKAKAAVKEYDPFKRPSISIDMALGAETIGEFIKLQLDEIGIGTNIKYMPFENLQEKILNGESEMYLLGFRSEIGDASSFFENLVHSKGNFNGGKFSNKKVDQLIDLSVTNLEQSKRLDQFQEIMRIITEEEYFGVPLFETDVIYGIKIGIQFHPRLDGYILANEIT
jgi:peptide/nickel transport system substrate-binding protein